MQKDTTPRIRTSCAAALLALSVVLSWFPAMAFAYTDGDAAYAQASHLRLAPDDIDNPQVAALYNPDNTTIPAYFNLRDVIDIPVADQGELGLCDTFAIVKSAETNHALQTGSYIDLSERYLDLATSTLLYATSRTPGLVSFKDGSFGGTSGDGSSAGEVLTVLSTTGAPTEESIPYGNYTTSQLGDIAAAAPALRVTGSVTFPYFDDAGEELQQAWIDIAKTHIMKYGSLDVAMWAPSYDDSYNPETAAYHYVQGVTATDGGHAVSVVGWDDNFPASNFLQVPSRDGAFICLNSWGKEFGDGGYFYVSYDEADFLCGASGVTSTEVPEAFNTYANSEKVFNSSGFATTEDRRVFGISFKTQAEGESLSRFVVAAGSMNDLAFDTSARFYVNPTDGTFDKEKLVYLGESRDLYATTQTVFELDEPVALEGESFALVVEMVGDEDELMFESALDASGEAVAGTMYAASSLDGTWELSPDEFSVHAYTLGGNAQVVQNPPVVPQDPTTPGSGGESADIPVLPDPPSVEPDIGEPAFSEPDEEDSGGTASADEGGSAAPAGNAAAQGDGTSSAAEGQPADGATQPVSTNAATADTAHVPATTSAATSPAATTSSAAPAAAPSAKTQLAATADTTGSVVPALAVTAIVCAAALHKSRKQHNPLHDQ